MPTPQRTHLSALVLTISLLSIGACSRKQAETGGDGIDNPDTPGATTSTRNDETTNPSKDEEQTPGATDTDQGGTQPSATDATNNSSTSVQSDDTLSGETTNTTTTTATSTDQTNAQGQILCGSKVWACGDGIDNDNDGKIDLDDPECISPCDDTEGTFATALPGQNSDCKSDCYFDADSGGGNDKCDFNLKCDILSPAANIGCAHDSSLTDCEASVPPTCLDVCLPLVPNGCDCFGCCEVKTSSGSKFIYLGSSDGCDLAHLDNCGSCTFNTQCSNSCNRQECELCFGDEQLPSHCTESSCPSGIRSCSTSSDCNSGEYCLTGCCAFSPG